MGRRGYSYVNERGNDARLDRAITRLHTLKEHGGSDVEIERAKKKCDDLAAAKNVMRGWDPLQPGVFN